MRLSKQLVPMILLAAAVCYGGPITTYTDEASFLAAAQAIPNTTLTDETFDEGTIAAPGLSVKTDSGMGPVAFPGYGRIVNGAWNDCLGRPCTDPSGRYFYYNETTWLFDQPTYAFGATFNYDPVTDASPGLTFMASSDQGSYAVSAPLSDGFFGFVSAAPFDQIYVAEGPGQWGDSLQQYYAMDNLLFAPDPPPADAPEPGTMGLAAMAGIGLLITIRRARA